MKLKHSLLNGARISLWLGAILGVLRDWDLFANPAGLTVVSGSGHAQQAGSQLNVTVSQTAILNWSSFNIKAGEATTFLQPSANSVVFNQIGDANPSQIFGNLNANGTVILANANGFYFGPNSMISIGGSFIATTSPLTPDFGAGSAWTFTGMPPLASIVNYGQIKVGTGKSLYLIAEQIDNHGELAAPGGDIGLYAGQSLLVSERPDGRGLSATMTVPGGSVNNFGQITADAGTIALQAQVVNQNGIIQADSVQNKNGVIELVASDSLTLGADSRILARGDDSTSGSSGGTVTLKSGNNFSDRAGGQISVAGGAQGGNGGSVEISAENLGDIHSQVDGSAQGGFSGGKILIDPTDLTLDSSSLNPYSGMASIDFKATGNITLAANTTWNLSTSTAKDNGQLTVEAGGNITFGNGAKITDAKNWSVTLDAGGSIYLNGGSGQTGSGSIHTSAGSVNLTAGQSILVGSGSIYSTGGGSIYAYAMAGDINAGTSNGAISGNTKASNYNFTDAGAMPNTAGLGGISTMAGGNVTLIAGNNINSTSIADTTKQWPAASGTYGSGDVNIIAGNQINGNYILANGVGTMLAGVQVQAAQAAVLQNPNASPTTYAATLHDLETAVTQAIGPKGNIGGVIVANKSSVGVSLSLIQGSWNVWAANNILLNEVNNPNGTYNKDSSSQTSYLYNYASDAAANFWAGNAIELGGGKVGGTLARLNLAKNLKTIIYAPKLSLNAGAGGIQVDASIILAPSSEGSLDIVTRDGGNLTGAVTPGSTTLTSITMSDSGSTGFSTFATGHAAKPLHLNDPNPVVVDISGSIGNFGLTVPTFAELTVHGTQPYVAPDGPVFGTYNFGFIGRNLSPLQTTFIDVTGAISYQDFSAANPDARLGSQGLTLAGPGFFDITANSINLGVSGGINVIAPDSGLAAISPYGAQLDVTTLGNLTLTSSAIANVGYLGGIQLNIGGELDAGGQFSQAGEAGAAKGIFTTSGGGVSVMAQGNVNVDGSRINTYNGGNINITSVNGDVNAGAGDAGYVNVHALELDPMTHQLVGISWQIPGSGIWATTLVGSHATVGNISVNAPKGSINASSGGILQIAFNGTDTKNSLIDLNAGLDIIASGSGVIGANVNLKAGRSISGLFVAQHNLNAAAPSFGAGVLFGQKVSVDTGNSGTPVGIQIISDNPVSENGVEVAATAPDVASAPTQVAQTAEDATAVADTANSLGDDTEEQNKKKKGITLASKVSRVTVLLPTKNN